MDSVVDLVLWAALLLPTIRAVCIKVVNDIKTASKGLTQLEEIETVLQKTCAKKTDPAEKKLCYYIEPIQREVSRPIKDKFPAEKICSNLKKSSSDICAVVYGVVVEENTDVTKMTLKQLRQVLAKRGVACEGCIEKSDFLKKVQDTAHIKADL